MTKHILKHIKIWGAGRGYPPTDVIVEGTGTEELFRYLVTCPGSIAGNYKEPTLRVRFSSLQRANDALVEAFKLELVEAQ